VLDKVRACVSDGRRALSVCVCCRWSRWRRQLCCRNTDTLDGHQGAAAGDVEAAGGIEGQREGDACCVHVRRCVMLLCARALTCCRVAALSPKRCRDSPTRTQPRWPPRRPKRSRSSRARRDRSPTTAARSSCRPTRCTRSRRMSARSKRSPTSTRTRRLLCARSSARSTRVRRVPRQSTTRSRRSSGCCRSSRRACSMCASRRALTLLLRSLAQHR
jgi:hypothetical protein